MYRKISGRQGIMSVLLIGAMLFTSTAITPTAAAPNNGSSSAPYSVTESIAHQGSSSVFVKGYVVGQPTSSSQVLFNGFNSDTALALADSPTEKDVADMLFVQVPSSFRTQYGLSSNKSMLGATIKLNGDLIAYFSHDGLKNVSSIVKVTGSDTGNTTPGDSTNPGGNTNPDGNTPTTSSPYDSTYYKSALGLKGSSLKSALHNIIKGHKQFSYDQVWNALKDTDQDPKNPNNVILLYTGRSQSKDSNGPNPNDWNREHVWAKSHGDFGTANGPGTDLHHLRPADVSVNADRGNLDFDNGGSPHGEATLCKYDSDSWEPRDAVKGDIARMLFYMAVRYEGDNGEVDLELNNKTNNGKDPFFGKLSVLLQWNKQDPVDSFEMNRNNVIYNKYQKNRNPFIDHPEWANQIWSSN